MWFGAAYYPEYRDPARWESDLDLMAAAHVNALRVGEFAWRRFEPSDGQYDFSWLDRFLDLAARRNIRLLLCPPLRTAPAWLVAQDRSILMIDHDGVQLEFGSRYTFCINHPRLREKGLALAARLARHYGRNPGVLGWHLDNEYGDEPDCYCPNCVKAWQAWLAARYGTIMALNEAWGSVFWSLEYDRFEQVPTPRRSKTFFAPAHLLAWRRFRSDCTVEIIHLHANALRSHGVAQFVTTNHQCLWNPRTDYYAAAPFLDVCGTNYYPPYGERYRDASLGLATVRSYRQANFQVHELRSGAHLIPGLADGTPALGEVERLALHCIGHGADGLFFFRWRACPFGCEQSHGSITDYDGRPTRIYPECQHLGAGLERLAALLAGTTVASDVGVFYDFPTRWVMEADCFWNGPGDLYLTRCRLLYRVLRSLGINVNAVGRTTDFSACKLLVVPFVAAVDDALAAKFSEYVERGGTLIWHPLCGGKNPDTAIYPGRLHPRLAALLGVRLHDFVTTGDRAPHHFTWNGQDYEAQLLLELPQLTTATKLGTYTQSWFAGVPAVTERRSGLGRAVFVATLAGEPFYRDLCGGLLTELGIRPILDPVPPPAIEIMERSAPDGRRLIFLLNATDHEQRLILRSPMTDVWHEEPCAGTVALPPFGVRILVPAGCGGRPR